jgi:hypothetical protein
MKNLVMLVLALSILGACKPEPYKEIGPRYDLATGISGSWEIQMVDGVDLTLPVPESRDISDFYMQTPDRLGLSFDSESQVYTVVNAQTPGNVFGQGGTFAFDDENYPSKISLYSSNSDTLEFDLLNMVREIDVNMGLTYTRTHCGTNYFRYEYTFKRIQQ